MLKSQGYTPVVLDNLSLGHKWAVQWGPLFEADIRDTEKVTKILKSENIEAVIHFAAYAYVGESMQNPLKYYQNNVAGSIALFEAMNAAQVKKIVFSSSCATYGVPAFTPISEEMPQSPVNPYGHTKLIVEEILKSLTNTSGFHSVALRYFNAAGADADLSVGEDHNPETHLLPLTIAAAFEERPIEVFGTDYPTVDGTCVRDYIHVTDLAMAHVKALKLLGDNSTNQFWAINLGTEKGTSVLEVIKTVEKITGKKISIKKSPRRAGDPPILVASSALAQKILDWTPENSNFENVVSTAVQWYEKYHLRKI